MRPQFIFILLMLTLYLPQAQSTWANPAIGSLPLQSDRISYDANYKRRVEQVPFQVAIIRSDIQLRDTKKEVNDQLFLWSSAYVYKINKNNAIDFFFLGIPDTGTETYPLQSGIGWVESKYLLDNPDALRTENKIYRRLIVIDNRKDSRVPIFQAPLPEAEKISDTPRFSFFYIYKEEEEYYLIGAAPSIDLERPDRDLLGWVSKKNCKEWNTRLAADHCNETKEQRIQEEEQGQPGLIRVYTSVENALAINKDFIISQEEPKLRHSYDTPRDPLLVTETRTGKRIFQVASLNGENSAQSQIILNKIQEEKKKLIQLDVLILMDASLQKPVRTAIMNGISQVFKQTTSAKTNKNFPLNIAFAAGFFHDFRPGTPYPYQRGKLFKPNVIDLQQQFHTNIPQIVNYINNFTYRPSNYEPRALYYAIDTAASNVSWRDGSSRCMIVVSRTGNHDITTSRHVANDLNAATVKEELQKRGIRLYGIQFNEPYNKTNIPAMQEYAKQVVELCQSMNEGGYLLLSPVQGSDTISKTFTFQMFLNMLLDHYEEEIELTHRLITDLGRGFLPEELLQRYSSPWKNFKETISRDVEKRVFPPTTFGNIRSTVFTPEAASVLQQFTDRYQIDIVELKKNSSFYIPGWVCEFNPSTNTQQIDVCMLIDKNEMARLLTFLASLAQELKGANNPTQYIQIWKTLLQSMFGIDTIPPNEPLDNLISQHSGLPFMNGVLRYTLDEFILLSQNPKFREELVAKLDKTCSDLNAILGEQEVEIIRTVGQAKVQQNKRRWWIEPSSGILYAWVEVTKFP